MLKLWHQDVTRRGSCRLRCFVAIIFLVIKYRTEFYSRQTSLPSVFCIIDLSLCVKTSFSASLFNQHLWKGGFKFQVHRCDFTCEGLIRNAGSKGMWDSVQIKFRQGLWGSQCSYFICPHYVWDIESGVLRKKKPGQSAVRWNFWFTWVCGWNTSYFRG